MVTGLVSRFGTLALRTATAILTQPNVVHSVSKFATAAFQQSSRNNPESLGKDRVKESLKLPFEKTVLGAPTFQFNRFSSQLTFSNIEAKHLGEIKSVVYRFTPETENPWIAGLSICFYDPETCKRTQKILAKDYGLTFSRTETELVFTTSDQDSVIKALNFIIDNNIFNDLNAKKYMTELKRFWK